MVKQSIRRIVQLLDMYALCCKGFYYSFCYWSQRWSYKQTTKVLQEKELSCRQESFTLAGCCLQCVRLCITVRYKMTFLHTEQTDALEYRGNYIDSKYRGESAVREQLNYSERRRGNITDIGILIGENSNFLTIPYLIWSAMMDSCVSVASFMFSYSTLNLTNVKQDGISCRWLLQLILDSSIQDQLLQRSNNRASYASF